MFDKTWPDLVSFGASDANEFVRLTAIVSLGMIRSVSLGAVTPEYACHRLFGPALVARARKSANAALVEALELATELEDVSALAPNGGTSRAPTQAEEDPGERKRTTLRAEECVGEANSDPSAGGLSAQQTLGSKP